MELRDNDARRQEPGSKQKLSVCWFDSCACSPAYRLVPGAALMGYVLFPVIKFAALESVVHLMQLLTLLAALVATVSLAVRWGAGRFEAVHSEYIIAGRDAERLRGAKALPPRAAARRNREASPRIANRPG